MLSRVGFLILCAAGLALWGCQARPETLEQVIKQHQERFVRVSSGPERYQCFTDDDLDAFKQRRVPATVAQELRASKDFIKIVLALKATPEAERRVTLLAARKSYQPMWEEIGEISAAGQTRAGQEAQREICVAVADLAEELLALPGNELLKMAQK